MNEQPTAKQSAHERLQRIRSYVEVCRPIEQPGMLADVSFLLELLVVETTPVLAWIPVGERMPSPHTHIWCLNRDGRQFEGAPCYGLHAPFFTIPHGDGSPSNTAPRWIDVTHWMPLPTRPVTPK